MRITLRNKQALVAGASRGIGYAIAAGLAKAGADVAVVSSNSKRIRAAADRISALGHAQAIPIAADLRTLSGCRRVFAHMRKRNRGLDILVNSAGDTQSGDFLKQDDQDWIDGFGLKFYSCMRLCRLFWPQLEAAQGAVVNIVGGYARTPDCDFMIGGSVNAAVANFSKALAGRGKRDGVRVNVIHPGMTETERIEQIFKDKAALAGTDPGQVRAASISAQGIRRLAAPEDIANLAVYLCSAHGSHIQGAAIAVDGGATSGLY